MRKVLLATTALFAVTGVASADVSINGYYEFGFNAISDDSTSDLDDMFSDTEIKITMSSSSDNGLSWGAVWEIEGEAETGSGTNIDEASLYISGDFGKFVLGQNDSADNYFITWPAAMRNTLGSYDAGSIEENSARASTSTFTGAYAFPQYSAGDDEKVYYQSPSMGGFVFGISYEESGTTEAETGMGMKYSTSFGDMGLTITAASHDSGETSDTDEKFHTGATLTSGAVELSVNHGTYKASSIDNSTTIIGAGYTVSDSVRVVAHVVESENKTSNDKLNASGVGISYVIAPGLDIAVGATNFDNTDTAGNNKGSSLKASINASF